MKKDTTKSRKAKQVVVKRKKSVNTGGAIVTEPDSVLYHRSVAGTRSGTVVLPVTRMEAASVGTHEGKESRIEIRVEPSIKDVIEKAAALLGQSVAAFVISHAVREARRVIEDENRTQATLADWEHLHGILAKPPSPNAALKKAARLYKKTITRADGD